MGTSQKPQQSMLGLLWDTVRLGARLFWKSASTPARSISERKQAFEILGLPSSATPAQIKQRYRKLAKRYHPDLGGDPRQMQRLTAAYELLMKDQH